jgi:putative ABC transport system ATP-binding protein
MHIRARAALKNHTRIGFSMGECILTAQNLSKVVPSAEGELTILHPN